ncbi:hypothetical protein VNO77_10616 [Canavalia gladiata]|uniref:DDE Tnp4 domain-containing protein n=1 Tax=Canavalia gladiata TaxID=3824 RepID=A0AAN9QUU7_CANGL
MIEASRKRRKKDEDGSTQKKKKKKELKGIFTSLLFLGAQEKREEEEEEEEKEKLFSIETNPKKKKKKKKKKKDNDMIEYYSNLDDYCSEVEESDPSKRKKLAGTGDSTTAVHHRRLWVKDRSGAWWDECNRPEFPEEEFRKAFRMGRVTFEAICEELNSVIAKEDTTLRNAIPVKQRVAVCLWRLATGDPLRVVSKRFGLGISTCHKLILEVCTAIRTVLMPKYLQWPNGVALRNIKDEFESISGIPNIVGSMFTSHVPIIAPKISVSAYFNKRHTEKNHKTSYSITVQGVVDHRGIFTDVCIGWPGSMGDDQVLEKSALFQRADSGGHLNGVWVVGGSGYPLLDWVLVPYTQQNLTWTQHAFNEKIGEVRKIAKDAFGRLKGRWCCLQKRTEVKLQDLPFVLGACCVLHNICELRNEEMDPELKIHLVNDEHDDVDDDDMVVPEVAMRSVSSMKARDAIAHNLLHHGLAGTSFL